jgi:hypothetical protein
VPPNLDSCLCRKARSLRSEGRRCRKGESLTAAQPVSGGVDSRAGRGFGRNRRGVSRRRLYVSRDKSAADESGSRVEGSRELLDLELPAVVIASGVFEPAKGICIRPPLPVLHSASLPVLR